jgi:hypothetical protein
MEKEICQTFIASRITKQQQKESLYYYIIATRKVTTVEELAT